MALVGPDAEHYDKRFTWLINGGYAALWLASAWLFWEAARRQAAKPQA